ncbi:DUF2169 family type VI secretion system accessory protein [Ralstonia sp. UBA689]|uniref:DUF2169 family type VI secretion system accessory protein n=1 Tax=Ralstonia sp. UBA689 TaxID=1947373 RepID=UPI0025ED4152|nr:DUF2169 domain-containing protein [Ralstonia sp. UBA689]
MKVLKPDNLALLYRTVRIARRHSLALAMMGHFEFARSELVQLLPETDMWKAAAQAMGGAVLDEGYPKPNGEFKVYGAAHAPQGGQVAQQRVSIRIGPLAKSLVVSGDRYFDALGVPSAPVPYSRMPIEPGAAFGGDGFADNPAGKGYAAVEEGGRATWHLPNVELESQRVLSRGDRVAPAGFWGYDSGSPQRQQYLGTCDERWLKQDWPHLPNDTQPAFFMSTPSDQWLAGYFAGNEVFDIHHMHPQHAALHGRLPGLRARCFVYGGVSGQAILREVQARADTVWLFPEQERGIVLYRAVVEITDSDAADVSHVMAEWEALDQPPLPFEHYRERFFSSIKAGTEAEPVDVSPAVAPAVTAAAAAAAATVPEAAATIEAAADTAAVDAEFAPLHAMTEDLNRQTRELMRKHNLSDADLAPFMKPAPETPAPTLEEVEKMAEDLNRQTRELMRKHNLTDADLAPFLKSPPDPAGAQALPDLLKQVQDETQASLKKAGLTEADVHAWVCSQPNLAHLTGALPPHGSPLPALDADALAQLAGGAAPAAAAAVPTMAAISSQDADAPQTAEAAPLTREDVIGYHAARRSLAGCDLSGIDLSGLDLCGADFSGALLERTSFAGCRLHGADFSNALLKETDFGAANLQRARLVQSSGGASRFVQADLRGAQLGKGDFTRGDFTQANLAGADVGGALFDQAEMTGVDASLCRAEGAQLTGCALSGANFSGAVLTQANFSGSQLGGSNFSAALCEGADFQGVRAQSAVFAEANLTASRAHADSCFDGAQFVRARLERASWGGAQLRAAVLEHAILDNADLSSVQAGNAQFRLASAKGAKFSKADLSGADLTAVNLFSGSLRKATLDGTLLRHANLYGVDFEETSPTIASLEGSNIDRTMLRFRPPVV